MNRTQSLPSDRGQARGEERNLRRLSREISLCFQVVTSARKENHRVLWESLQRNADPVWGSGKFAEGGTVELRCEA